MLSHATVVRLTRKLRSRIAIIARIEFDQVFFLRNQRGAGAVLFLVHVAGGKRLVYELAKVSQSGRNIIQIYGFQSERGNFVKGQLTAICQSIGACWPWELAIAPLPGHPCMDLANPGASSGRPRSSGELASLPSRRSCRRLRCSMLCFVGLDEVNDEDGQY